MQLLCGTRALDLTHPAVMGVVNVTPDSFSDGGRYLEHDAAVAHGVRLAEEGAAILDVGGESTRPGAEPVTAKEELRRVLPVIEGLVAKTQAIVSIDTAKPEVMCAAAAAGAGLINDIRALQAPGALTAAAKSGCAIVLMHMQGEPRTMQQTPRYTDVVEEVGIFLRERAAVCLEAGIASERIAIDPGFGFGKTLDHNLELLRALPELSRGPWPVLVGLSRKSMLKAITGREPDARLHGSVALAVMAVLGGARIVRVHDVAATVDAIKVACVVRESR